MPCPPSTGAGVHFTELRICPAYAMRPSPVFLLILTAVTLAFGAILWELHGAVYWGMVLAILFSPLHQRLRRRLPGRDNLAALCTLVLCLLIVILPLTLVSISLVQEATAL